MTDKFTQYFDTKIYWTDEIDGCGNTMIDDFLDATSFITDDKTFFNTLEWCSGPGFWGFGLLGTGKTEKITLSDVWEPNKPAVLQTILENNLDDKAHFFLSDNFKSIPEQTSASVVFYGTYNTALDFCKTLFAKGPSTTKGPSCKRHYLFTCAAFKPI